MSFPGSHGNSHVEQRTSQERPAAVGGEPHGPAGRGGPEVRRDVPEGPGSSGHERRLRILEPLRHSDHQQPGHEEQRDLGDSEQRPLSASPSECRHGQSERRRKPHDQSHQDEHGQTFLHADWWQQRNWNKLIKAEWWWNMQTVKDVEIFVKHLLCSYVLYIDLKKELLSIDREIVGYSHFAILLCRHLWMFFLYIKTLFNLYLRIPRVLGRAVAQKKGTCVQINDAKSRLSLSLSLSLLRTAAQCC